MISVHSPCNKIPSLIAIFSLTNMQMDSIFACNLCLQSFLLLSDILLQISVPVIHIIVKLELCSESVKNIRVLNFPA